MKNYFITIVIASALTLDVVPQLATNDTLTTVIGPDGGAIELSRFDGTKVVLTVPTNALAEPQYISMTLVTNFIGLPFAPLKACRELPKVSVPPAAFS